MKTYPLSLAALAQRPDTDIIAWQGVRAITFASFQSDVKKAAARFVSYSAAALICQDSYYFMVGFFGLLHAGARIVLPPGQQADVLRSLRDKYDILVDDVVLADALQTEEGRELNLFDPDLPHIDFFTSGSTGASKCVTKSLSMFDRELAVAEKLWGPDEGSGKVFATVPHQHVYGITFKLLWSLAAQRAFTSETYALWEPLLAALTPYSILISSPAHLSRLTGLDPLPEEKRPALVLSAGSPLSFEASQEAEKILGCRPTEIFGSTETGALATRSQKDGTEPWKLLSGITMKTDPDGILSVLTPFIGGDWIDLSDVVTPTEGGFFYRGRADRIVKIEGKRLSLFNVEEVLQANPLIKKAAVVALNNSAQLAAAVIVSDEGREVLDKVGTFRFNRLLRKSLISSLEPAAIPRLWRYVEEFPNQAMGKRRDADIAALFIEGP